MKKATVGLFVLFFAALRVDLTYSKSIFERQLANFLLNKTIYNPAIRPVEFYADTLTIKHGLTIGQLIKLDEKSQTITTSVLLHLEWHDLFLMWDPSLYGGITEFNVDIKLIWFPQISLFNNADDSLDTIAIPRAIVRYDGSVTAVMPRILKSTCKIKVKDFPFDRQICELKFGSFQFDTTKMDIKPLNQHIQLHDLQKNAEWKLEKNVVKEGLIYHAFSDKLLFNQLSYKLQLDRKPLYYTANFLIPCILIAMITVLLFLIPSDTGEQMAVGVTILLSMAVFFLLLEDKMPETSDDVPLIGKYFACTIVEASLAVGAVCMVLCFHHHEPTDLPPWMRKYILGKLATILFIKTSENTKNSKGITKGKVSYKLKKFKNSERNADETTVKVARKRLLIWQAKAKAKRLRREKRERETAKLFLRNDDTELTSISQEDLQNTEVVYQTTLTSKTLKAKIGKKQDMQGTNGPDADEDTKSQSDSRNSSLVADDTRALISNHNKPAKKGASTNDAPVMKMDHVNLVNRMMKMKDNVRQRFKKKDKANQETEVIESTLFKVMPAENWQEADHKSVKLMADTIQEGDRDDQKRGEWKEVAKVINYFMMWLYIGSLFFTFFALIGPIIFGTIPDNSL